MSNNGKRYTAVGTDIEKVKRQNAQAGNGKSAALNTSSFGSNPQQVREEIAQDLSGASFSGKQPGKTVVGTDIAEVKRLNAQSGMSFNEVLNELATNPQKVREEIAKEAGPFPSGSGASFGKTVVDTNIAEVKRQNAQASKKR